MKVTQSVRLFVIPWTIMSMELSRPEYWSGSPFPSAVDLPNPGIELEFPSLQVDSLQAELLGKPLWKEGTSKSSNSAILLINILYSFFP